jgi:Family of unknown function (DUF5908)
MTIEIKQLIIRAVVEEKREQTLAAPPRSPAAPEPVRRSTAKAATGVDREALIAACTRQVLRELRKGRGR